MPAEPPASRSHASRSRPWRLGHFWRVHLTARGVSDVIFPTRITDGCAHQDLLLAAALAVSASCKLQEPASIDGLDPDPAADTLVISPQDIRVPKGSYVIFSAPDETVEGTPVTGPVEWTVAGGEGGTITTAGLFQASDTGGYMVQGKRSGKSGHSKVTVTQSAPTLTSVSITPNSVTLQPGAAFTFVINGVMSDGTTVPVTGTWTATGGTVTSAGVYTAGTTSGQFRVIATQSGGTFADTAAVTISTAAPTLQSVQVTPATVSLTLAVLNSSVPSVA